MFAPLHPRATLALSTLVCCALLLAACRGGGDAESTPAGDPAASSQDAPATAEASAGGDPAGALAALPTPQSPLRSGTPRPYALGFSAVPAALSRAAYADVFDQAALHADALMIQRAVPWPEVAPGAALEPETSATIGWERQLLADRDLQLVFAIDPWQPTDRGSLSAAAPGRSFSDAAVREAYVAYAVLVAEQYRPRWLALGVDVDAALRARPETIDDFEAAYREAYAAVKAVAPGTAVFLIFQFEDLQGLLPWSGHPPQWSLILRFDDVLDLLAVSSFPSFVFPFASDIPGEYFSRLQAFDKPLALVPVGYASQPARGGVTFGTVRGQATFLAALLREAEAMGWELVVWLNPVDASFAEAPPFDLVAHMGLRDARGAVKPAWTAWLAQAGRPWLPSPRAPAAADAG